MTEQHKPSAQAERASAATAAHAVQAVPPAPSATSAATAPGAGTASPASTMGTIGNASKAALGPLTIRDLMVLASIVIIFVASVVPMSVRLVGGLNLWNVSGLFYLGIGVVLPLIVGGLFLVRRLSPEVKIRVGSLSVDQCASVVAAFATYFFFIATVTNFSIAYLLGLIGALLMLVSTVCAQWIPVLASDFAGRAEVPAHVAARDAVPAVKRPSAPKPVAPQAAGRGYAGQGQNQASQFGASQGAAGQFGHGQNQQANPNQQSNQNQGGWAAPQPNTGHAAAGQIFTPAKENTASAAGVTPGQPTHSDSAANTSVQNIPATSSGAGQSTDNHGPAASSAKASNSSAVPTASGSASAPTAPGGPDAVGLSPQRPAGEGTATTLNPQVAESKTTAQTAPAARESIAATVNPTPSRVVAEPFWFAVDRPQNVIDQKTRQFAFKLMPGSWILALEDRGNSFLVQDSHGKTGVLLDLVGIERAADSQ